MFFVIAAIIIPIIVNIVSDLIFERFIEYFLAVVSAKPDEVLARKELVVEVR